MTRRPSTRDGDGDGDGDGRRLVARAWDGCESDGAAELRDRLAEERDSAARARDRLWAELDAQTARTLGADDVCGPSGLSVRSETGQDGRVAAECLRRAVEQRQAAARDRELAAEDRRHAAADRLRAAERVAQEGIDELTGVQRRRVGLTAMQAALDRAHRTGEPLVVAFVDVDGLKATNDTCGHLAGDRLLRTVAHTISRHLRSYDVVARFGGDEFVCLLQDQDERGARSRFEEISERLTRASAAATISVGFAGRRDGDSLEGLIRRADGAMLRNRGVRS